MVLPPRQDVEPVAAERQVALLDDHEGVWAEAERETHDHAGSRVQ